MRMRPVAPETKPADFERLRIVVVMGLDGLFAANLARASGDLARSKRSGDRVVCAVFFRVLIATLELGIADLLLPFRLLEPFAVTL